MTRGLELSVYPLTSEDRGRTRDFQSPMSSDLINDAYVMKLPETPLNDRIWELPG